MAINISDQYPGRANPPSVDYPQGSIKNQTAPGARDGTPLDEAWANDKEGFFQKALSYRGVTANGTPDTATSSQYFDALFADPTESLRGMPMVATQAEVEAGLIDGKTVSPKKMRAGFAALFAANGYIAFPTWLGGLIIQWGNANVVGITGTSFLYPTAFKDQAFALVGVVHDVSSTAVFATGYVTGTQKTNGAFRLNDASTRGVHWIAIGK